MALVDSLSPRRRSGERVRERGFQLAAPSRWKVPLSPALSPLVPRREREQGVSTMAVVSRCARTSRKLPFELAGMFLPVRESSEFIRGIHSFIFRVHRSCSQITSLLFGEGRMSGITPPLTRGGMVRSSSQRLISEWPSAKESPPARL